MTKRLFAAVAFVMAGTLTPALAQKPPADHARGAAADHRAMADAHLNAAKCLEAGKTEKECHEQLAKDCKGLGIGKYCGLKHKH
jgi:hypothetical protein